MKIFYFTGTGNSLSIANKLNQNLNNTADLIPMENRIQEKDETIKEEIIGFCFPLYYYGLPKLVHKFIRKMNFKNTKYIFAIITSEDSNGFALTQLKSIFTRKNLEFNVGFYLKMPKNFTIENKFQNAYVQNKILNKADQKLIKYSKIIGMKRNKFSIENGIKLKLLKAIKKYKKAIKRTHNFDSDFTINEVCNRCATCEKNCPFNNIHILLDGPSWKGKCQRCLRCINICPGNAILYKETQFMQYINPEITVHDFEITNSGYIEVNFK